MTLVSIPANPVPDDVVAGTFKTPDGVSLRFARWAPPRGRKGTVCLFQGRSEFIEKYFETARDLRARGFAVATFDWRGQGMSERALGNPRKGHVRNFAQYQIDLESFINEIVLPDCPPPLFALGQSMGATILLHAAYAGHRWFDRMVLLGADGRAAGTLRRKPHLGEGDARDRARLALRAGRERGDDHAAPFQGQPAHVRSGALRP